MNIDELTKRLEAANAEGKQTIRELHGLIKDAKAIQKEMQTFMADGGIKLVLAALKVRLNEMLPRTEAELIKQYNDRTAAVVAEVNQLTREYRVTLDKLNLYLDLQGS